MLDLISQRNRRGFTLVEIMIVVAIIALLAAISVPSFLRARERSQAAAMLNNLRLLDAGKDQWALETNQTQGQPAIAYEAGPPRSGLAMHLKQGIAIRDAAIAAGAVSSFADPMFAGTTYELGTIGEPVGINANPFTVVPDSFFAGFTVAGVLQAP